MDGESSESGRSERSELAQAEARRNGRRLSFSAEYGGIATCYNMLGAYKLKTA